MPKVQTIAWSEGLKTETCNEGGMMVTEIQSGDYIKGKGVDFGSGATSLDVRVASAGSGGNIEVRLDGRTGTLVGTCTVAGTGGAQTWATKTCPISGASGVHDLFFVFTGSGTGSSFNFNWWKFTGTPSDGGVGGQDGGDAGTSTGGSGGTGAGGTSGTTISRPPEGGCSASCSSTGGKGGSSSGGTTSDKAGSSGSGGASSTGSTSSGQGGQSTSVSNGASASGGRSSASSTSASSGTLAQGGSSSTVITSSGISSSTAAPKATVDSSGCSCELGRSSGRHQAVLGLALLAVPSASETIRPKIGPFRA